MVLLRAAPSSPVVLQLRGEPARAELLQIQRGQVAVLHRWCADALVTALRADVLELRDAGALRPSGLSNQSPGDENVFDPTRDRHCATVTSGLRASPAALLARAAVELDLEALGRELSAALGRPGLSLQEQYYSISTESARLPLHLDERHEETKGGLGWCVSRVI